jgi:hypothetical protein
MKMKRCLSDSGSCNLNNETMLRGNKASVELRERFLKAFAADDYAAVRGLSADLRNCTDTLPSTVCVALGLPRGSTYAKAARTIMTGD